MIYKFVVVLAVFTAACAQMLLKKAATIKYSSILRQYFNPWVLGGYTVMGLVMLVNIFAMSKGVQLKEVGTIEALSYLFVPCLSWIFFHEKLSWLKAAAIAIIMLGISVFFI